jgi:hydrogenase maturation protease
MTERILILGLGNELMSDDAAGLVLARIVYDMLPEGTAHLVLADLAGLSLMHALEGYDRVIIIDTIESSDYAPGECLRTAPGGILESRRMLGQHDTSLSEALHIGSELNLKLPHYIIAYLIVGADTHKFSDKLSPAVERTLPEAARRIINEEFGEKK